MKPEPLIISWRGRQLRIRHDDPKLKPYSPQASRLRSAVELARCRQQAENLGIRGRL